MAKGKNVLTTGDVAKICNVAPRTVTKWFDNDQLKGYRIPGSKDRRIPVNELIKFMKEHNIPASAPIGEIRILIVDSDGGAAGQLADNLKSKTNYETEIVKNTFEAGYKAQKFDPHVMLINLLAENINATDICKNLRQDKDLQTIKVLAIANQLSDAEQQALMQKGFDGFISDRTDTDQVIKQIEQAIAIVY